MAKSATVTALVDLMEMHMPVDVLVEDHWEADDDAIGLRVNGELFYIQLQEATSDHLVEEAEDEEQAVAELDPGLYLVPELTEEQGDEEHRIG